MNATCCFAMINYFFCTLCMQDLGVTTACCYRYHSVRSSDFRFVLLVVLSRTICCRFNAMSIKKKLS